MANSKKLKEKQNDKNALLSAYGKALDLKIYEGELVWSRFGVMLAIQTVLLTLIGILIKNDKGIDANILWTLFPASIIGLYFCYLWKNVTARGFFTNKYWMYVAKELEYRMNVPNLNMLRKGYHLYLDEDVVFRFGSDDKDVMHYQRPKELRKIKTEESAYKIIRIFQIIYWVLFVFGVLSILSNI